MTVYDSWGEEVGTVVQRVLTWLPKFEIYDHGNYLGCISKELFHLTDTYVIEVPNPDHALDALLFVLAIDAEKCSRNN